MGGDFKPQSHPAVALQALCDRLHSAQGVGTAETIRGRSGKSRPAHANLHLANRSDIDGNDPT